MALRTIPVISNPSELQQYLAQISTGLGPTLRHVQTPSIPFNFKLTTKQGGNLLEWGAVTGADGYKIDISTTGDFSTGFSTIVLNSQVAVSYFDAVPTQGGTAPSARFYRIRATAGTISQPHSVEGISTVVIKGTAIAPNDTVTASASNRDVYTAELTNAGTGKGNYGGDYRGRG